MKKLVLAALLASVATGQDAPLRSVWDGVYSEAQSQRGQSSYNQYCMACHGASLTGGEQAPPLSGGEFLANWNGLTVGDLFDRIRTSMPLNNPRSLNRETNAAILSYILSFNRFPTGQAELPSRSEVLKLIRLEAERPSTK